jgi:PAS domain S-box-containing protein
LRLLPIFSVVTLIVAALLDVAIAARFLSTAWAYVAAASTVAALLHAQLAWRLGRANAHGIASGAGGGFSRHRALQTYAASVARSLRALYGRSCAFVLLAAPTGEAAAGVQFLSNLDRADGTDLLRRLFASWQEPAIGTPSVSDSMWQVLEDAHDAVILWQMDGAGIVYWNQAAESLYGYSREEVRGHVTHALLKTVPSSAGIAELEQKLARYGMWVGELEHTARDGRRILVVSRLSLMAQVDGKWFVLELNRDITDHVGAEQTSRAAEEQLSALRRRLRAA